MMEVEAAVMHRTLLQVAGAGLPERRLGVWLEHSYALGGARRDRVRELLPAAAALAPPPPGEPDVVRAPSPPPPSPPSSPPPTTLPDDHFDVPDDDGEESGWEDKLALAAGSAASGVLEVLRALRLALAAGAGRRVSIRAAGARLRRVLAPTWVSGRAAVLHAALKTLLPPSLRTLYDKALMELHLPARLMRRLLPPGAPLPEAVEDPISIIGPPLPEAGPVVLLLAGSGQARTDARWAARLAARLPARVLPAPAAPAPPDAAAARAGALRSEIMHARARTPCGACVCVGWGAGAALLAAALGTGGGAAGAGGAGGAGGPGGVRGAALLGPPLLTAAGARDRPADLLHQMSIPLLLVSGEEGRDLAAGLQTAGGGGAARGAGRRTLLVRGAGEGLRLTERAMRRTGLPQEAVDAAIVEEVCRWALELAENAEDDSDTGDADSDEYLHLPHAAPATLATPATPAPATRHAQSPRGIEIIEGRVVSRVSGSTPLQLRPPAPPATPSGPPGAPPAGPPTPVDIADMPIVFADDLDLSANNSASASPKPATTPRGAGSLRYTRVIVAKRGQGAASGGAGGGNARTPMLVRRVQQH